MKIDRFVKAVLVLIALLLAVNCVSNLSNSSNSQANLGNAPGSSKTPLIGNNVEAAQLPPMQYKVERVDYGTSEQVLEQRLNALAAQGWAVQTVITPLTGSGGFSNVILQKAR